MKILINCSNNIGGGGLQVALSFIHECRSIIGVEFAILLGKTSSAQVDKDLFPSNFTFYDIPSMNYCYLNNYLKRLEKKILPDVVFTVFGPSYYRPSVPHVCGYAIPHYVYHDSPFWKTTSLKDRMILFLKRKIHLYFFSRDVDIFVCETDDITNRIKPIFGKKKDYFTVSNTCGKQYFDQSLYMLSDRLPKREENEFRLLTLSRFYSHKNIHLIPALLKELLKKGVRNIKFILTITEEEFQRYIGNDFRENVITVGSVSINECPSLYRECDAMFLPTTLECFSASYPEAMIMKKPIITSDLGFARSICKDAALYFDPTSIADIADKITQIVTNMTLQKTLIKLGLERVKEFPSATKRAEEYVQICNNAIK